MYQIAPTQNRGSLQSVAGADREAPTITTPQYLFLCFFQTTGNDEEAIVEYNEYIRSHEVKTVPIGEGTVGQWKADQQFMKVYEFARFNPPEVFMTQASHLLPKVALRLLDIIDSEKPREALKAAELVLRVLKLTEREAPAEDAVRAVLSELTRVQGGGAPLEPPNEGAVAAEFTTREVEDAS